MTQRHESATFSIVWISAYVTNSGTVNIPEAFISFANLQNSFKLQRTVTYIHQAKLKGLLRSTHANLGSKLSLTLAYPSGLGPPSPGIETFPFPKSPGSWA